MYGQAAPFKQDTLAEFGFASRGCTNVNGSHECSHQNNVTCIQYHRHAFACPWATGDYSQTHPKDRGIPVTETATIQPVTEPAKLRSEVWLIVRRPSDDSYGETEIVKTIFCLSNEHSVVTNAIEKFLAENDDDEYLAFRQVETDVKVERTVTLVAA